MDEDDDGPRIERRPDGDFDIELSEGERDLLRAVAPQLRSLLDDDLADPGLRRLFPVAYNQDPERDHEYQALVKDELADRRRAAVDTLLATLDADRLSEPELLAWIGAVNDIRLVLGTRLDVTEGMEAMPDQSDPDAPLLALYGYLGYLLESLVDAVSE